jgi:hypothetical protein
VRRGENIANLAMVTHRKQEQRATAAAICNETTTNPTRAYLVCGLS